MTAEAFRARHHSGPALILPNAWDPVSAKIIAASGAPAVATSSGAMARVLGYDDGELTPAAEMLTAVARVVQAVDVPVTADMEAGYGLAAKEFTERLLETGVVGCNLEDSGSGGLTDLAQFADYLAEVRATAGADLVINARVDVFLFQGTVADAVTRGRTYRRAGADCVYPIFAPVDVLPELVAEIGGPINAHAAPAGPTPAELIAAGARRVSYGTSVHSHLMSALEGLLPSLH
ncbi:isocitrate lyase/phosphoenolpyruvate mutase family protein [Kribbella sandramycini]|uniref:2-methylisocitrate lyase-like PEP mutase family enzyme n=1 Tax=Kribbella sandramycini TaxID=60450 RepID=A0A7Y4L439_9ACTN|nr:isocitrate lyase/phosphoenolpyruvate mutase family protein [Kribbella sandramycini]MBB6570833.1 2-methylisocitrate lyase-like PEP mutase family enzyme [Kribbella sandramycini]NOL43964.1 isocitrate lyase/phosphoenolpyruvate mutase family protein [Kribbella sandramycini]